MSRFQRLLRQIKQAFTPYKPLKRPTWLIDDELELRRAVARDLMGDTQVRPLFKGRAIDYDRTPPPV
jgi:hypothetical protein